MKNPIEERTLSEIGQSYAALRIISPQAEVAMARSLELYGQMSPVVCVNGPGGLELLDGFKRLRACHKLQWTNVRIVLLATTVRACKAGMIRLNRIARSITDLEEALILHSLHRDDSLPQVEIAVLVGRDKSWVSRRISLVERLHEEVKRHLQLGLISVSVGRELAKLPRGNQPEVLSKILKNRLGKRDVEKVVRFLLPRRPLEYGVILSNLHEILCPSRLAPATTRQGFFRKLAELERLQQSLSNSAMQDFPSEGKAEEFLLHSVIESCGDLVVRLKDLLNDTSLEEF